jgi:hypothetical protein
MDICSELGIQNIVRAMDEMLVVDFLIANEDRHFNNFGLLRNPETLEWIGAAPIFDSGSSLGYDSLPNRFLSANIPCKPFKKTHAAQIQLVSSFEWIDFNMLDGIDDEIQDILSGGHINNPEFLQEFFKNRFKDKFMQPYKFVAQKDLDSYKDELVDYVKSIVEKAKEKNLGEITEKMLQKASNANLKWNAINWGAGFITSAIFLSTIIPKTQYFITKWRTGSDEFPGTAQFREQEGVGK